MRKQKINSEGQFRQFVDETSPEQAAEVERNWRKKTKQEKNKLFTRILIAATIVIAIIFVIILNFFIDSRTSHNILDQDQDGYTVVRTNFPHLVTLISNQIQTYQTKMVRNIGVVYGELISWIQANVASNNKILYVPNQTSGTTLLGMTLGYYVSRTNGGSVDVLIQTDAYKQQMAKNAELMKNLKDQKLVLNYLSSQDPIRNDYNFLIVENNDYLNSIQLTKFKSVVEIKKNKWDNVAIGNYLKNYIKYEITKGRFNSQTLSLGQFKSYSVSQLKESARDQYKIILILNKQQQNLNLCPENIQFFRTSSQKRNLVEYFRNKTLASKELLFFCLNDTQTFKSIVQLDNIGDSVISGNSAIDAIRQQKSPFSTSVKHTYILTWADFNQFKTKLKGDILIFISSQQQASQIATFVNSNAVKIISPLNNNGCLFPPQVFSYKTINPFHPFFLLMTKN